MAPTPTEPGPGRPRRRRWRRILTLVGVNLLVLAVVDVILGSLLNDRVFETAPELKWGQADPDLGFRPRPNTVQRTEFRGYPGGILEVRHNGQRLRSDVDYAVPKPPGTVRIVVVGDSHTAGILQNSHTYPSRLQDELRSATGKSVEVLNAGVKRYSPLQSYLRLEKELLVFDPDIVLAAVYVGNDLLDLLRLDDRPSLAEVDGRIELRPPQLVIYEPSLLPFWSERSFLYQFYRDKFGYAMDRAWMIADLVSAFGGNLPDAIEFAQSLNTSNRYLLSQTLLQTLFFERHPEAEERSLRFLRHVVGLHRDLARRDGHDLWFVLIPSRLQLEKDSFRKWLERAYGAVGLGPEFLDGDDRLYARLLELMQEEGVQVIDPLPAMRAAFQPRHRLFWWEYHININGAEVVGRAVAERLLPRVENAR